MKLTQRRFETLGNTMLKISQKILGDYELCKMLKYSDTRSTADCPLFDPIELIDQSIINRPLLPTDDAKKSLIVILLPEFDVNDFNEEFIITTIQIDIFVPFADWGRVDNNLKPFLMMAHVDTLLNGARVNGLGTLTLSNASLLTLDNKMGGYRMLYTIDEFN